MSKKQTSGMSRAELLNAEKCKVAKAAAVGIKRAYPALSVEICEDGRSVQVELHDIEGLPVLEFTVRELQAC